jgi:hypothetical protein
LPVRIFYIPGILKGEQQFRDAILCYAGRFCSLMY